MYSLPDELLELIAAAGQERRVPDSQGAFKSEWTLSQISRRLREVIVGAPTLWTFVEANLEAEGSVEILNLYLERSGGCSIWITLQSLTDHEDVHEFYVLQERLSQIVPHIYCIWRLSVVLKTKWARQLLAPFCDIAAPNLQHLEVDYGTVYPVKLFSSGAPRLTFLNMDGFIPSPASPWTASLTNIQFHNMYLFHDLVKITALCLVGPFIPRSDPKYTGAPLSHPIFEVPPPRDSDNEGRFYLPGIVDLFDTPILTEFRIDGTHGDQIYPVYMWSQVSHLTHDCLSTALPRAILSNLVDDILGSTRPWPLLKTVTLSPMESDVEEVHNALLAAIRTRHQRGEPLPKCRLSPVLFSKEAWRDYAGADVEKVLDPVD
ncbi:hypothetical protein B0H19DRAFT_1366935 [Mycena capillaripes]|nr:hypothetical protein B0H19DRAFT_1366935 [Mycena capillaripes]